MGLADSLAQQQDESYRCKVQRYVDSLDENDRVAYEAAVANGVSARRLATALNENGMSVSASSVQHHLSGVCPCR